MIPITTFAGKKVAVFGLGGSGLIEKTAAKVGVSPAIVSAALATVLPMVIQHFAPNGQATPATGMTGMQSQINGLQSQVNHANSGVAMAMAMGGGFLPDSKKFAVAASYGNFTGQGALGLTALGRVTDNLVLTGSFGYSTANNTNEYGGRVGMQVAW